MTSPKLVHLSCGLGRGLSTHRTLLTRFQVMRKRVEGQERTTSIQEVARLYRPDRAKASKIID